MDIENMHPFCLPFSLCHDATSSSLADECLHEDKPKGSGADTELSDLFLTDLSRLVGSGPSSPAHHHRLSLSDDHFIGSSMCDGADSRDAFDALHLDIDMRTDDDFGLQLDDEATCSKSDDWFSVSATHDCPLFSPVGGAAPTALTRHQPRPPAASSSAAERAATNHYAKASAPSYPIFSGVHGHQVFQHVVDPIDIKSSPTLAQLNLNSSDDPTDGLWDATTSASATLATTTTTTSTSTLISTSAQQHQQRLNRHHHANSSSTSDLLPSPASCIGSSEAAPLGTLASCPPDRASLSTCNHLNSYHSHHNHQPASFASSAHFGAQPAQGTACNHHHHHHPTQHHTHAYHIPVPTEQPHHQQSEGGQQSFAGACPAATSAFRKDLSPCQQRRAATQACCQDQCARQQPALGLAPKQACLVGSSPADQHRHKPADLHAQSGLFQHPCSSPAPLVTSSSSPLSSSSAQNLPGENKLKENIDYLSILLYNSGSKLDKPSPQATQQSATISSSMVKSYSTLAQSLATGPKLLERYQQVGGQSQQQQQHDSVIVPAPFGNAVQQRAPDQQATASEIQSDGQLSGAKRVCASQWFKPESSVSAADSTAENQLPVCGVHGERVSSLSCATYTQPSVHVAQVTTVDHAQASASKPAGGMKMLGTLLGAGKYPSPASPLEPASTTRNFVTNDSCASQTAWTASCQVHSHVQQQAGQLLALHNNNNGLFPNAMPSSSQKSIQTQESAPAIPATGRPITLVPLVSSNVIINQRPAAGQQLNFKSRAPTFAQPASPSTSSTTSSSGHMESACSQSSGVQGTKSKPKSSSGGSSTGKRGEQCANGKRAGRPNSLSTDCSLSSHDEGFSSQVDQDEGANSDRDSDDDSDIDSDDESFYGDYTNSDLIGASISDNPDCKWTLNIGRTRRSGQRRFFWQYNVQSKGPKGARICPADGAENPFVLPEASDPVFSNECQVEGVKHSGKARRGDGNDLTPNPRKLLMIGLELKKLSKIINELAPVTDLPINARNKTRKEKNKLASRACRLKKKAQHEANKIKLYGLQREHQQVVMAIYDARNKIHKALAQPALANSVAGSANSDLSSDIKGLLERCSMNVASQTSDYVNSVLEKVVSGCIDGGLQT